MHWHMRRTRKLLIKYLLFELSEFVLQSILCRHSVSSVWDPLMGNTHLVDIDAHVDRVRNRICNFLGVLHLLPDLVHRCIHLEGPPISHCN